MTTNLFITGDRSFEPITAVSVVAAVMNTLIAETGGALRVITGDSPTGIERAIRYLVPEQFLTVYKYGTDAEGRTDFLSAMTELKGIADGGAYVIHLDPLNSRLAQAVSQKFEPDLVHFPLDVLSNKAPEDLSMFDTELQAPVSEEEVAPEDEK